MSGSGTKTDVRRGAGTVKRMDDPKNDRAVALDRLNAKRGFNAALVSYVVVNAFLWAIWALSDSRSMPPWPIWVTLGWGIGMAFGAWRVYGQRPITEADIEREMGKGGGPISSP